MCYTSFTLLEGGTWQVRRHCRECSSSVMLRSLCQTSSCVRADVFRPDAEEEGPGDPDDGALRQRLPHRAAHFMPMWQWLIGEHPEILDGSAASTWCGRPSTRNAGSLPVMRSCGWILAVQAAHLALWIFGRRKRLATCMTVSNGQESNRGAPGKSACATFLLCNESMVGWWPAATASCSDDPWEGANDYYREISHHGGILSNEFFGKSWYERQCLSVQHGKLAPQDPWLMESITGPETLDDEKLREHRIDTPGENRNHALDDE